MKDDLTNLYESLIGSKLYQPNELGGSEQGFRKYMADSVNRKKVYDIIKANDDFELPDYETYEGALSAVDYLQDTQDVNAKAAEQIADSTELKRPEMPKELAEPTFTADQLDSMSGVRAADTQSIATRPDIELQDKARIQEIQDQRKIQYAEKRKQNDEQISKIQKELLERRRKGGQTQLTSPTGVTFTANIDKDIDALEASLTQLEAENDKIDAALQGGGVLDAFGDVFSRASTYDFGLSELHDAETMLRISKKVERGEELTDAEKTLMETAQSRNLADAQLQDLVTSRYGFGETGAMSMPFAAQFFMSNPFVSGIKFGSKKAATEIAKRGIEQAWKKNTMKAIGATADDVARASIMTNTIQLPSTLAKTEKGITGQATTDGDKYAFVDQKSMLNSFYRAQAENTIENYTEMAGAHFGKVGEMISTKFNKAVGLSKMNDFLLGLKSNEFLKALNKGFNKLGVQDFTSELLEEELAIPLNAAFLQEYPGSVKEFLQQQYDIVGGLLTGIYAMRGAGYVAGATATGTYRVLDFMAAKKELRTAEKDGQKAFGHDWESLRDQIDNANNNDLAATMADIYTNNNFSAEQMDVLDQYFRKLVEYRGTNIGQMIAKRDGLTTVEDDEATESYMGGYNTDDATEMSQIRNRFSDAAVALEGLFTPEQVKNIESGYPSEEWQSYTEEQKAAVQEYNAAKNAYEGMLDHQRDDIEDTIDDANREVDSRVNPDGMIHQITDKGKKEGYVTKGNLVLNEDGSVNVAQSTPSLAILYKDGSKGMISPKDIIAAEMPQDPNEQKAASEQSIINEKTTNALTKIDGGFELKPGNKVNILDSGNNTFEVTILSGADDSGNISVDMGGMQTTMSVDDLVTMVKAYNAANQQVQPSQPVAPQAPTYEREQQIELQVGDDVISGEVTDVPVDAEGNFDPNGEYSIYLSSPINDKTNIKLTAQQIADMQPKAATPEVTPEVEQVQPQAPQATEQVTQPEPKVKPTDEKGNVIYEQMPIADTVLDLHEMMDDNNDVVGIIEANIEASQKELDKVNKKAPDAKKFTNPAEFVAKKKAWQTERDAAQAKVDYWNGVKAENEKVTYTAYKPVEVAPEVSAEPLSAEEYIATQLGSAIRITPESYRGETGYGVEEQKQLVGVIASAEKGGVTIERASEILHENGALAKFGNPSQTDIRDMIIEVLKDGNPRGYAKRRAEERAAADQQALDNQREETAQADLGMSADDAAAYEETAATRLASQQKERDEAMQAAVEETPIEEVTEDTTEGKPAEEKPSKKYSVADRPGLVRDSYTRDVPEGDLIDKIAKLLGLRVEFVDDAGPGDAFIRGNDVFIKKTGYQENSAKNAKLKAADGQKTLKFLIGHEFTHRMQDMAPEQYAKYKAFVREYMGEEFDSEVSRTRKLYDRHNANVRNKIARAKLNVENWQEYVREKGWREINISDEQIADEVTADFSGRLVNNEDVFNKFLDKLKEKEDGKTLMQTIRDIFKAIRDFFAPADKRRERIEGAIKQLEDLISAASETEVAYFDTSTDETRLSLSSYEMEGRKYLKDYLAGRVRNKHLTKAEAAEILAKTDELYDICNKYRKEYTPFSNWSDAKVVRGKNGKPVFSVIKPNGEYAMNLDFSLVCKKRRTLDAVFNEMIKRNIIDDVILGQVEIAKINDIIRRYGFETACRLCFVDARRFRVAEVADTFCDVYNSLVKELIPKDSNIKLNYFDFADEGSVHHRNALENIPSSELNIAALKRIKSKEESKKSVVSKCIDHLIAHPEDRKLLRRSDFVSTQGFDNVKERNQAILSLYNAKKGSGGPKAAFGDVQYLNDIAKKQWRLKKAYDVGGVRIQSFSDYVPRMVFDYIQMISELAAKKLPAHAYTKEKMFVLQFGKTGVKINMSLVPAVAEDGIAPGLDKNGNYVWQIGETFDYDDAVAIQNTPGYRENCGTIAVGVSDAHIRKMLADPNIRMVIPYHKSGLNQAVAIHNKINAFQDYTDYQNTRYADGTALRTKDYDAEHPKIKEPDYNAWVVELKDPRKAAQKYLDWCKENNLLPKFSQFAYNEDGTMNENYYKVLEDFTTLVPNESGEMEYHPQEGVRMEFPTKEDAFGSMEELIKEGLEEDAILEGRRDENISKIVDDIQSEMYGEEGKRLSISEDFAITPEPNEMEAIEAKARVNGTYLKAPNGKPTNLNPRQWAQVRTKAFKNWFGDWENDPENASKVVDENGEPKVVYHGTKSEFTAFDLDKIGDNLDYGTAGYGIYFTEDRQNAENIARNSEGESEPKVVEVFLNIRNPKENVSITELDGSKNAAVRFTNDAKRKGFDGVAPERFGLKWWVTFEPNQIKSATENVGTFSAESDDIRYKESPSISREQGQERTVDVYKTEDGYVAEDMSGVYRSIPALLDAYRERHQGELVMLDETYEDFPRFVVTSEGYEGITGKTPFSQREKARAIKSTTELANKLGVKVKFVESNIPAEYRNSKGWIDDETNEVNIVLPNNYSANDCKRTLLFNAVGRYGLRKFFGERYDEFLNLAYSKGVQSIKTRIDDLAERENISKMQATEKYIASLAEDENFEKPEVQTWWGKLREIIVDVFDELFDWRPAFSDNELRYVLWRSYDYMTEKEGRTNPFAPSDEVRFRMDNGPQGSAIDEYNEAVRKDKNMWYRLKEAYQDNMLSLKKLQDAISNETGNEIEDYENAYMAQNAMSSASLAQWTEYKNKFITPLKDAVAKIASKMENGLDDVNAYLMAKHGLERNEVFAERDAQAYADKWEEKQVAKAQEAYNKAKQSEDAKLRYWTQKYQEQVDNKTITSEQRDEEVAKLQAIHTKNMAKAAAAYETAKERAKRDKVKKYLDKLDENRKNDYSGLTELTKKEGEKENPYFKSRAQEIVDDFEKGNKSEVDNLWKLINAATKESLKSSYKAGMITKDNYEYIKGMFEYYVPLRGWENDEAGKEYEYLDQHKMHLSPAVTKKAEGRKSQADNVVATIAFNGQSTILLNNRNQMKQHLFNLVMNNPTDLARADKQWYVYNAAEDVWTEAYPEKDETYEEFEARMKELGDNAKQKRVRLNTGLHMRKSEKNEHMVSMFVNGQKYNVYIQGDPRAAQAINGLLNPDTARFLINEDITKAATSVKHFMARMFTSSNPAFIFSNMARDLVWARTAISTKEPKEYSKQYNDNIWNLFWNSAQFKEGGTPDLIKKFDNGNLDMNNEVERYFYEFIMNGGETGFTNIISIEDHKRDLRRLVKELENAGKNTAKAKKVWRAIWDEVEFINRSVEDMTRFAVYMTSRQQGRTVQRSVYDAKEVTVNFNKKGAGFLGAQWANTMYVFFNAAVQSIANFAKLMRNYPAKFAKKIGQFVALGMFMPVLSISISMLFGDDDNKYYDLPQWIRSNNIVLCLGDVSFTIPLPHELRPFYAIGENAVSVLLGKQDAAEALVNSAMNFSTMLPLDFTGNDMNPIINLTPTYAQPFVQIGMNTDFFGKPIYKKTPFNERKPEWTKAYKGTSPILVDITKGLNYITGGDEAKSGVVDINPAMVEHVLESYLGGVGKTVNKTAKTIGSAVRWTFGGDAPELRNIPVVSSFVQGSDPRTSGSAVIDEYYNMVEEFRDMDYLLSEYNSLIKQGKTEYKEARKELLTDDFKKRHSIIDNYSKNISKMRSDLKYISSEERRKKIEDEILKRQKEMVEKVNNLDK